MTDRPAPAPGLGRSVMSGFVATRMRSLLALAVLIGGALVLGWHLTGGAWQVVATPSMGQSAPVGTVVLTRPVAVSELTVGDTVTFHPPGSDRSYTHRVVELDADGGLRTRGDLNGATDPWTLHDSDLVGKVVARWWGIGWLIRSLPLLIVGGALVWAVSRFYVRLRWRRPVRLFGTSLLVAICSYLLKPFVNISALMSVTDATTNSTAVTVVSTGLLPIRVTATGGDYVDLIDGQVGTVHATVDAATGGYRVDTGLHLTLPWLVVLILIWLSPLIWCLIVGAVPVDPDVVERPRRRWRTVPATALLLVGGLGVASMVSQGTSARLTMSAFNARITNSVTTAASSPYFTCRAAAIGHAAYFVYPLGDASVIPGATAADVSGNARNGTYTGTFAASATKSCTRDTTGSVTLSGLTTHIQTPNTVVNPTVFSEEVWFKTTTGGGKLVGFGNTKTGLSSQYDRHLFLSNAGNVVFGVYPNAVKTINSPLTYLDGNWHHVVSTLSSAGMLLYVDGALVASDATTTTAENYTGYWRVGYDNISGWGTYQPTNFYYTGSLAFAAVYTTALTAAQVTQHYVAGR